MRQVPDPPLTGRSPVRVEPIFDMTTDVTPDPGQALSSNLSHTGSQSEESAHPTTKLRRLVIVPAFNESGSIARVVTQLRAELTGFDVAVIDDGSTDQTFRNIPAGVTVLRLPFNLGIGSAMQTGYRYALMNGYDVAVQVDGDGQHPPEEVNKLVDHLLSSRADMVVGSRFLEPNGYRQGTLRRLGAQVLSGLTRLLVGRTVSDCTSGFRAVNRRLIRAFALWYPEDYPEPEVILLLYRAGFEIREIAVRMDQRTSGRSSIPLSRGVFYVIKVSVSLLLDMIREPWTDLEPIGPSRLKGETDP